MNIKFLYSLLEWLAVPTVLMNLDELKMNRKLALMFKPLLRTLLIAGLAFTLVLSNADGALAARSGGRIGGGSFRRPAPVQPYRQSPSRPYPGGGYYPGGGFGFPFLIPFFGVGGGFGSLFTILISLAIANFLFQSFRRAREGSEGTLGYGDSYSNPPVSVANLQVGLLAEARDLQPELDQIAQRANTGSSEGLTHVLQETVLSLLRHPEYWAYASSETQQARLLEAEEKFNRLALAERSKLQEETLSNVNRQLRQATDKALPESKSTQQLLTEGPGEYIVVTVLVASQGNLKLPQINSSADLRQALNQLGAVSSEQLLALEVLWTPQAENDTLTAEDVIATYPNLKLV